VKVENVEKYIKEHGVEYSLAKMEAVFAVLCPYCKHRWGVHAIVGCQHKDCKNDKNEGCKYDGIRAIRTMMKDENFKFKFVPKPEEKVEVQTKLG